MCKDGISTCLLAPGGDVWWDDDWYTELPLLAVGATLAALEDGPADLDLLEWWCRLADDEDLLRIDWSLRSLDTDVDLRLFSPDVTATATAAAAPDVSAGADTASLDNELDLRCDLDFLAAFSSLAQRKQTLCQHWIYRATWAINRNIIDIISMNYSLYNVRFTNYRFTSTSYW